MSEDTIPEGQRLQHLQPIRVFLRPEKPSIDEMREDFHAFARHVQGQGGMTGQHQAQASAYGGGFGFMDQMFGRYR